VKGNTLRCVPTLQRRKVSRKSTRMPFCATNAHVSFTRDRGSSRHLPAHAVPLRAYRCAQPCLQLHPHQPQSLATVLLWRARHFDDPGTSAFSPHNSGMTDSNGQNASVPQHCICTSAFHPFPPLAHRPFWFVSVCVLFLLSQ
jgi:hypothetical protein